MARRARGHVRAFRPDSLGGGSGSRYGTYIQASVARLSHAGTVGSVLMSSACSIVPFFTRDIGWVGSREKEERGRTRARMRRPGVAKRRRRTKKPYLLEQQNIRRKFAPALLHAPLLADFQLTRRCKLGTGSDTPCEQKKKPCDGHVERWGPCSSSSSLWWRRRCTAP